MYPLDRTFLLENGLIYCGLGVVKLEDMNKSFEVISYTKISYIIEGVRKYGYSIDWGGEYIAWDKTIFSANSIYNIVKSGYESGGVGFNGISNPRMIYLNEFRTACRNSKLNEIGI